MTPQRVSHHRSNQSPTSVALAWLLVALGSATWAQEPPPADNAELVALLDAARRYEVRLARPDVALKLREPSVLNFTNPQRNQERGSVFVWLHEDRPAAIGQFFCFDNAAGRLTKHAFHSLADGPLQAKTGEALAWAPDKPGLEWRTASDAPPPGPTRVTRLLQMRQLARRFRVNLIDPKEKSTELRLAPRPLFEYAAPRAGATDGVIFSYVVATDPEAILLIEAFDEGGQSGFRYAFARFHFWKLEATDGDRQVWEVAFDPRMIGNRFANPETVNKVYNSFHP